MQNHSPHLSPRKSKNHFLVFVHQHKLSPLILNDQQNSFEIFTIGTVTEFVNCFQSQRPGCLVTDTDNDFFSHANLNLMSRLLPVVMVTNSSSITTAADAARKGAHTVLRNFDNEDKVKDAIRSACFADSNGEYCPYEMRCRVNKLTTKERQVMYMSLRGKTTKIISGELGVCHQTIDKHKKRALSKLQSGSVVELMNTLLDTHRIASGQKVYIPQTRRLPEEAKQPDTNLQNDPSIRVN